MMDNDFLRFLILDIVAIWPIGWAVRRLKKGHAQPALSPTVERQMKFQALFEHTNDAIFFISLEGVILEANLQASLMLGYTVEEMVGSPAETYIHPDERTHFQDRLRRINQGEIQPVYERRFIGRDQNIIFGEVNSAMVYNDAGKPDHIHSIVRNITVRKASERQLLQQHNYLKALQTATLDIVQRISMGDLLSQLLHDVVHVLDAQYGVVCRLDEETQEIEVIDSVLDPDPRGTRTKRSDLGIISRIWDTSGWQIIDDYSQWEYRKSNANYDKLHYTVGAPIWVSGKLAGALVLSLYDPHRQFDDGEIEVLRQFVSLASVAMEKAQLLNRVEEARDLLESRVEERTNTITQLLQITRNLAYATSEDEMVQALASQAIHDGVNSVAWYYLYVDDAGQPAYFELNAIWRRAPSDAVMQIGDRFYISSFPAFNLFLEMPNQALFVEDIDDHPMVDAATASLFKYFTTHAFVSIALTQGGKWVGVLVYNWFDGPHHFSQEAKDIYDGLVGVAAPAFANQRRAKELQRAQLNTLLRLSTQLNEVRLESELVNVVWAAFQEFNLSVVALYYAQDVGLDAPTQLQLDTYYTDAGLAWQAERNATFYATDYPFTKHIFANRESPILVTDIQHDLRIDSETRTFFTEQGLRRLVFVPLVQRAQWIGVMLLGWATAGEFAEAEQSIINALPSMVSPVIENMRLVGNLAETAAMAQIAREDAEAANHAKSVFLANMSHELRTPMNAILGFAELMEADSDLSQHHREYVKTILQSGTHLLSLINSVLDMSKIEAGKLVLDEKTFNVYDLLDVIYRMFSERAAKKKLDFRIQRGDDVPQFVTADEAKLRQILINLVGNAFKFTESGLVAVYVHFAHSPRPTLMFSISDTGMGISPSEQKQVFEPFIQANPRHRQEGTGLGLAIARQFVGLMGGSIGLESTPNQGTIVTFDVLATPANPPPNYITHSPYGQVTGVDWRGRDPYRVLVVDDVYSNRQVLVQQLSPLGFNILLADSGQRAIDIATTWQPHLILMDIHMPHLDGASAAAHIREQLPTVKIIAVTASLLQHNAPASFETMDAVLYKPIMRDILLREIENQLDITYSYDTKNGAADDKAWLRQALADLPPVMHTRLREAVAEINIPQIRDIIAELRQPHSSLAEALEDYLIHYRLDQINRFLSEER